MPKKEDIGTISSVGTFLVVLAGLGVVAFTPAQNAKAIDQIIEAGAQRAEEQSEFNAEIQVAIAKIAGVQAGTVDNLTELKDTMRDLERRTRMLEIGRGGGE